VHDSFRRTIEQVHGRYASLASGALADYIPELTRADPSHFGIVVVTADGETYGVGDVDTPFTIQSVSKAFAYGMALDEHGPTVVERYVSVEPSGEAFNSISLDPQTGRPRNPMINAGAIAITGLLPGTPARPRFDHLLETFSRYAGRSLGWDRQVYASESASGFRNRAIANLLRSFEIVGDPVEAVVEDYFRQCSILVTCNDLGQMAATLANGGVNPRTGVRALGETHLEKVLSVMSSCGMYDYSGTWLYDVGLPAKSGVGGGVVGVLPGQFGFASYAPLLDAKGNSVRGVAAFQELSRVLDLHLLRTPSMSAHAIRRSYRLAEVASSRGRPDAHHAVLSELARRVLIVELQGDLLASSVERLVREVRRHDDDVDTVVVDLVRAGATDRSTHGLFRDLACDLHTSDRQLLVADPAGRLEPGAFAELDVVVTSTLDEALLVCEEHLLAAAGEPAPGTEELSLTAFDLVDRLSDHERARLLPRFGELEVPAGTAIIEHGTDADALFLLAEGVVRVLQVDPVTGREDRIADLYPGVTFGELGLLGGARRSATVRALSDARCYVLTRETLMHLRRTDHLVYTRIVEHLLVSSAERLRRANREAAMLRG
jgi:glutaminase